MIREESIENLKVAKRILDDLGIPFFLFLGTALGAYRDNNFCGGDEDDIDLAVLSDHHHRLPEIREKFEAAGFLSHEYDDSRAVSPEVMFKKQHEGWHTKVDIFFVVPKDGEKVVWSFYCPAQNKVLQRNYFLRPTQTVFLGEYVNLPSPIEDYLAENYGDWKTPIHRDNWSWQTDNKCPKI